MSGHRVPGPDPDEGISWRMLLAAAMLRRGDDPTVVAGETGVPVALVDLMSREIDTPVKPVVLAPLDAVRRRQTASAVLILGALAVANVVACVAGLLRHSILFGVSSGVVAVAATAALHLLGRGAAPAARPSRPVPRRPPDPTRR